MLPIFHNDFLQVLQKPQADLFLKKTKKQNTFYMKDVSAQYVHHKNEKL